jgi:uncharacterized protein YndB with AHSA1/START domain
MTDDIADLVGAVTREVRNREHEGRPARVVIASRNYDTTIEDLWDALTNAERIPRWFLPISGELHLGGRYQFKGNAGGTITKCEPPHHLAVTWEYGSDVSWVDVRLEAHASEDVRLELEHVAHVDDARWDQFGPGAVGVGWDLGLIGLARHLVSSAALDPQVAAVWSASGEGKTFMRLSSDGWRRASIASGTSEAAAASAAARTTAFYTGEGGGNSTGG